MTPDFLSAAAEALFLSIPGDEFIYCDKCNKEICIVSDSSYLDLTCCVGCEQNLCYDCYLCEDKMTRSAQLDCDDCYCKICWVNEQSEKSDAIWAEALAALPNK